MTLVSRFFPTMGADVFDQEPPQAFQCISSGTDTPGTVIIRPGVLTKTGRWMNAGSTAATAYVVFTSTGQPGDIVDVTLDYTLVEPESQPAGHTLVSSSVVAGLIYQNNYLDNTTTSSTTGTQNLVNTADFPTALGVG